MASKTLGRRRETLCELRGRRAMEAKSNDDTVPISGPRGKEGPKSLSAATATRPGPRLGPAMLLGLHSEVRGVQFTEECLIITSD